MFEQKLLYSGKVVFVASIGCIWEKAVVFRQSGCNRTKGLYSGKVVVFGRGGCIW